MRKKRLPPNSVIGHQELSYGYPFTVSSLRVAIVGRG